jgi:hypothetical protein
MKSPPALADATYCRQPLHCRERNRPPMPANPADLERVDVLLR